MPGSDLPIRVVEPADLSVFSQAMRALARDLGDPYRADDATLHQALFGLNPAAMGLLAGHGTAALGAALASPVFSTTYGGTGVFVSDLWVDAAARGQGLGQRLLAATAAEAANRWQARYLRLTVYDDNTRAKDFYARMGFTIRAADRNAILKPDQFTQLAGAPV